MARIKGLAVPFKFTTDGYPTAATDDELLSDSILTVLLTVVGERVMRPTFGSYLRRLVFPNMNKALGLRAIAEIRRALRQWEPRVTVLGVTFQQDDARHTLNLNVSWAAAGREATTTVPFVV